LTKGSRERHKKTPFSSRSLMDLNNDIRPSSRSAYAAWNCYAPSGWFWTHMLLEATPSVVTTGSLRPGLFAVECLRSLPRRSSGNSTRRVNTSIWSVRCLTLTSETLDGIGGPDGAVQRLRKVVKGQGLVFLLGQAPDGLWREFALLGECSQQAGSRRPPW
jgi:hypothetical protein